MSFCAWARGNYLGIWVLPKKSDFGSIPVLWGACARLGAVYSSVRWYFRYLLSVPSVPQGCMWVKIHKVSIYEVYIKVNFGWRFFFFFSRLYFQNGNFSSFFQNFVKAALRAITGPAHRFFWLFWPNSKNLDL